MEINQSNMRGTIIEIENIVIFHKTDDDFPINLR